MLRSIGLMLNTVGFMLIGMVLWIAFGIDAFPGVHSPQGARVLAGEAVCVALLGGAVLGAHNARERKRMKAFAGKLGSDIGKKIGTESATASALITALVDLVDIDGLPAWALSDVIVSAAAQSETSEEAIKRVISTEVRGRLDSGSWAINDASGSRLGLIMDYAFVGEKFTTTSDAA